MFLKKETFELEQKNIGIKSVLISDILGRKLFYENSIQKTINPVELTNLKLSSLQNTVYIYTIEYEDGSIKNGKVLFTGE